MNKKPLVAMTLLNGVCTYTDKQCKNPYLENSDNDELRLGTAK